MSLFKVGDRLWVKQCGVFPPQQQWIQSPVLNIRSVTGPLGCPIFVYDLVDGTFYEMTLKNFKWLHGRTHAVTPLLGGRAMRHGDNCAAQRR